MRINKVTMRFGASVRKDNDERSKIRNRQIGPVFKSNLLQVGHAFAERTSSNWKLPREEVDSKTESDLHQNQPR